MSTIVTPRDLGRKDEMRQTLGAMAKIVEAGDAAGIAGVVILRDGRTLQVEDYPGVPLNLVIGALEYAKAKAVGRLGAMEAKQIAAAAPAAVVHEINRETTKQ